MRVGGRHALAREVRRILWLYLALNTVTCVVLFTTTILRTVKTQTEYRMELSAGGTVQMHPMSIQDARNLAAERQKSNNGRP